MNLSYGLTTQLDPVSLRGVMSIPDSIVLLGDQEPVEPRGGNLVDAFMLRVQELELNHSGVPP